LEVGLYTQAYTKAECISCEQRAEGLGAELHTAVDDFVGREVLEFLDRLALGWAHL
jgi:hypothetical protein